MAIGIKDAERIVAAKRLPELEKELDELLDYMLTTPAQRISDQKRDRLNQLNKAIGRIKGE